jgi:DNA-3-methyladenine glycosylase I
MEAVGDADVVVGDDGLARCRWGASSDEYRAYHDLEWGRPVSDDDRVYEKLCLEGFQAGLSWITILRKRAAFRAAFAAFDPMVVAKFDDHDVERLLSDAAIVRHPGKIAATIANARATIAMREQGDALVSLFWRHRPGAERAPRRLADLPASTPESSALSGELRRLGFAFVGPTTVYSTMQSIGVVNDHLRGCRWRAVVDEERSKFVPPDLA